MTAMPELVDGHRREDMHVLARDLRALVARFASMAQALAGVGFKTERTDQWIELIVAECDRADEFIAESLSPTGAEALDFGQAWPQRSVRALIVGDSYDRLSIVREALVAAAIDCEIHCPGLLSPISEGSAPTVCFVVENARIDLVPQIQRTRRMSPNLPILVIWTRANAADFLSLIAAGAVGCIGVDRIGVLNRLPELLQAAAGGQAVVPRELVRLLVEDVWNRSGQERLAVLGLTRREEEILTLLLSGMTTKEMASRFYVSAVTIRTHLSAIYRKVGVNDRSSAIELLRRLD
jgi:DNA-binding NarL/FixJ family response regulator